MLGSEFTVEHNCDVLFVAACGTGCAECTSDAADAVTCTSCVMTYYLTAAKACACE